MEWADPAVHHHGILRCRRVVFVRTQGKRNRSALDHLQFPISMWAIIGRLANYNQHNFPSSSRSPCIPLRFHDKAICIEKIVTKAASCTPSCGSSVRRWVAIRTKQASALDVALFHQEQNRSIGVHFGKNGHDFRLYKSLQD